MKTNNQLFSLLFFFFFAVNNIYSQEKYQSVTGVVYDQATKERLIGAHVSLQDTTLNRHTVTDQDGRFILEDIPVGRIRLACNYLAYKNTNHTFFCT